MIASQKRIAICPGHHIFSPGVDITHNNDGEERHFIEHHQALMIAIKIKDMLGEYDVKIIEGKITKKASVINAWNADLAIDIHFNGNIDPDVGGIMTLHSGSVLSIKLAELIQSRMVHCIGLKDRGTPHGYYQLNPQNRLCGFLRLTNCPAVITEGLYLTNPKEAALLIRPSTKYAYALGIAQGIENYFKMIA